MANRSPWGPSRYKVSVTPELVVTNVGHRAATASNELRHRKRLAQGMARLKRRRPVLRLGALRLADQRRVRQDQRLAFPAKPEVAVEPRLVEIGIKLRDDAPRVPERREESNLRRTAARRADFGEHLQQRHVVRLVGLLVGDVKDDEVNSRVSQHLRVAAQDIGIVGEIVAELRLAPVMHGAHRTPRRAGGVAHRVGVPLEDFGDIVRAAVDVRSVPEEIEHTHPSVWSRWTGLGGVGQHPAQSVRGGPGIAHRVPGRSGWRWLVSASAFKSAHSGRHRPLRPCQTCDQGRRSDCILSR